MAFKMKGFDPGKGTGMNKAAMKMARKKVKNISLQDLKKVSKNPEQGKLRLSKDYTPQTKSRKDTKSDIMPQTVKDNIISKVNKTRKQDTQARISKFLKPKDVKRRIGVDINKNTQAKSPNKKKKFPDLNKDGKITQADVLMGRGVIKSPNKMKKSPMKKMDPPAKQAKIKKMIIAGIEKGKDDRDILKKVREMSDGSVEYTYNRKTKKVKVYPKGHSGFEGELETDPDKG